MLIIYSYRCQVLTDDLILLPFANSQVGILSLKTQEIVYKLDASQFSVTKPLGEVMAIKHCGLENNNIVLVAYESGAIALWETKEKMVLSWLDTETCPMAMNFDNYWNRGIIGNPTDKLEVN